MMDATPRRLVGTLWREFDQGLVGTRTASVHEQRSLGRRRGPKRRVHDSIGRAIQPSRLIDGQTDEIGARDQRLVGEVAGTQAPQARRRNLELELGLAPAQQRLGHSAGMLEIDVGDHVVRRDRVRRDDLDRIESVDLSLEQHAGAC